MKNRLLSIIYILSSNALAGTMGPVIEPPAYSWVAAVSAGPVWADNVSSQTFALAPEIIKTYTASSINNPLFDGEVFLGLQHPVSPIFQGQLGLAVAATSNAKLSGDIWDDASPEFNNLSYSYKIQHTHVALKGKLLYDTPFWLIPWVSASVGVGFNDAHGFQNTPKIFEALPNSNFSSNTETSFTYTLGAGVQKALSQNWQVGIGYEFADWGKSSLGRAFGQTLNSGLSLNHLYTNGFLINLTYLS